MIETLNFDATDIHILDISTCFQILCYLKKTVVYIIRFQVPWLLLHYVTRGLIQYIYSSRMHYGISLKALHSTAFKKTCRNLSEYTDVTSSFSTETVIARRLKFICQIKLMIFLKKKRKKKTRN